MINYGTIQALTEESDFTVHESTAERLGFTLFVKRAKIGKNKHIRVRPRFNRWECGGTVTVLDEMITSAVLNNILTFAGVYCGIGDWRPSSPDKPGSFGQFSVELCEV
jgi:hypothetical protein